METCSSHVYVSLLWIDFEIESLDAVQYSCSAISDFMYQESISFCLDYPALQITTSEHKFRDEFILSMKGFYFDFRIIFNSRLLVAIINKENNPLRLFPDNGLDKWRKSILWFYGHP